MSKNKKAETQVKLMSLGQYTRKLSFDVAKTPYELARHSGIKRNLEFKLATRKILLGDNDHEIILSIELESNIEETKENIFKVTMEYSGIFKLEGDMSQEIEDEILLVNCVTLLFPIRTATISRGYLIRRVSTNNARPDRF